MRDSAKGQRLRRLFLDAPHLEWFRGMGHPYTELIAQIFGHLASASGSNPGLGRYIPDLLRTDFLILSEQLRDEYVLIISPEMKGHLPTWGVEQEFLKAARDDGRELRLNDALAIDMSETPFAAARFAELFVERGPVIAGDYPFGPPDDRNYDAWRTKQEASAVAAANHIIKWAERKRAEVENSKIFLSHRGINKPLIEQIDRAFRMLNLKTWFDKDDLSAGDTLVRGVDNAFAECSAAVFFITGDYVDAGVIGKEIDRAIHEAATRGGGFRIIPLVLAQHGGTDECVPDPLKTLVWKTVDDIDIVPTVLRSLPPVSQNMVRYLAPK